MSDPHTDIQDMIRAGIERIFSTLVDAPLLAASEAGVWPADLWQAVEDAGYTQVLDGASTNDDDSAHWSNALPVLLALGEARAPLPLAETLIARALLSRAGLALPNGPLSVIQQQPGDGLTLRIDGATLHIDGLAPAVPWARQARAIVLAGAVDGRALLALLDPRSDGCAIEPGVNAAGEARDVVRFTRHACAVWTACDGWLAERPVQLCGALARAVMMTGAAQRLLDQSVQYANEREQFGRPIGKFQAVQQSLAILAGEVTAARSAVDAACEAAGSAPRFFDVAVAKIRAGQAGAQAAAIAHQVHGAIGFTQEHTLHYASRRIWSWRAEFGAESVWAEALGRQVIAAGADGFWNGLTDRDASAVR